VHVCTHQANYEHNPYVSLRSAYSTHSTPSSWYPCRLLFIPEGHSVHVCTHQAKYVNILPYVSLRSAYSTRRTASSLGNKRFALTWYCALTWYASPARPFTAPDVPLLVTGQQGSLSPACRQLSRARNACAGGSSEGSTNLMHGTKLGRTLAILAGCSSYRRSTPSPPSCGLSPPPRYPYRLLFIPEGHSVHVCTHQAKYVNTPVCVSSLRVLNT